MSADDDVALVVAHYRALSPEGRARFDAAKADDERADASVRTRELHASLFEYWRFHHGSLSKRAAARQMIAEGVRYETSRWRRGDRSDCYCASVPAEIRGTREAELFAIFRLGGMPGERQLRRILGHQAALNGPTNMAPREST